MQQDDLATPFIPSENLDIEEYAMDTEECIGDNDRVAVNGSAIEFKGFDRRNRHTKLIN